MVLAFLVNQLDNSILDDGNNPLTIGNRHTRTAWQTKTASEEMLAHPVHIGHTTASRLAQHTVCQFLSLHSG